MAPHLSPGARVATGAVVLATALVGVPVTFYGTGAVVDALVDRDVISCEEISCGIGTGFLLLIVSAIFLVLAACLALVLPICLPRTFTTGRALATGAAAGGAAVAVLLVAMSLVFLSGPSTSP